MNGKSKPEAGGWAKLADILRTHLVRCGNDVSRANLAQRLQGEGMTAEQLTTLCNTLADRGYNQAKTASHIGQVLRDRESWREFCGDAAYAETARCGKRHHARNMPADNDAAWAQRDRAFRQYVRERVNIDGMEPAWMAEHTGKTLEQIRAILTETA